MAHLVLDYGVDAGGGRSLRRRVTAHLPLESFEAKLAVFDHLAYLVHFLLPEKPLPLFDSLVDPDAFDLIADLLPLTIIVILLEAAGAEGQKHHTLLKVLPRHVMQDLFCETRRGEFLRRTPTRG
jgi:hypothetical protein